MDLGQCRFDRLEVPEHIRRQDGVEGSVLEREALANTHNPMVSVVEGKHLRRRVKSHHLAAGEDLVGGSGPGAEVEDPPPGKLLNRTLPPGLVSSKRQNGV